MMCGLGAGNPPHRAPTTASLVLEGRHRRLCQESHDWRWNDPLHLFNHFLNLEPSDEVHEIIDEVRHSGDSWHERENTQDHMHLTA